MDIERLKELKIAKQVLILNKAVVEYELATSKEDQDFIKAVETAIALIDEAIARQSVKSEEVQREINRLTDALKQTKEAAKELKEQKYAVNMLPVYDQIKSLELAITALQAYQPWVSVSERLPTEKDADENGYVLVLFSDRAVESWSIDEIDDWNTDELRVVGDFGCITHWRSMLPEPPKGE